MNLTTAIEVCRQSGYTMLSGPDTTFLVVLGGACLIAIGYIGGIGHGLD